MAEAIILSPLVQVILDNVTSLIKEPISTISGAEKDLKKLSETMLLIDGVLRDAEEKQVKDAAVRNWLRQLKDATFDADDILDEWATEARWKIQGTPRTHGRKVCNFLFPCFCLSKVVFLHGIGNKIKEMRERLQEIANKRSSFDLKVGTLEKKVEIRETGSFFRETIYFVDKSNILGRDDDREKIVNLLVSDEYGQEDLSVIPIVGLGGMGKTTLAQYVFNDERVMKCFQLMMWVCVSEDFEERSLISRIMKSATRESGESLDLYQLQQRLHKILSGTKFLLVLDDIWNEDYEKWEKIRAILSSCARGSSIIVTTRSEKVSSIMSTTPAIRLKGLSNDDCWSLLMTQALGEGDEELHPNLIPIGKEIVKKCRGVPLTAKTLGSILHFKREENEWLHVKESEIWNLEANGILNSLKLSDNHLPSRLKQCFVYCAIFPKDYRLSKKVLIQLWMAEGLIQPSTGRKEMEEIGNEYFNELLGSSFFQDVEDDDYDVTCQMPNFFHDLALSIAGNDCYIIEDGKLETIPEKVRYLSMVHELDVKIPDLVYETKNLRTFLHPSDSYPFSLMEVSNSLFLKLTHLRVLDLGNSDIKVLPESVGNLKHLRFLDLSETGIRSLPESTSKLRNLQTLVLRGCYLLSEFPKGMKNMINLRHFEMDIYSLRSMPIEIGKLTCLQTLSLFVVGKESGYRIGELHHLKNLRGKIRIQNLEKVVYMEEAEEANLKNKQHLRSLELCWSFVDEFNGEVEEGVLESLQPNNDLRDLSIVNYRGTKFPTWMMNLSLTNNLVKISLRYCGKCNHLPPFGRLPFLKELRMYQMDEIKYLSSDVFYGQGNEETEFPELEILSLEETEFPKLEILSLEEMPKLVDLSRGGGEGKLNNLLELYIRGCPNLRSLPLLLSLIKLELCKCEEVPIPTFLPHLTNLSSLEISGFKDLTPFQEGFRQLSALKSLTIRGSDELVSMEHLTSLEELSIRGCANQTSLHLLPNPNKLRRLEIEGFLELTSVSEALQNLTALRSLKISNCPRLMLLPEETMQHLTSLETLDIFNSPNLTRLLEGAQHLTSLKFLSIKGCPDLSSLPECVGNLSSSLERLEIDGCPKLSYLPDAVQHLTTSRRGLRKRRKGLA